MSTAPKHLFEQQEYKWNLRVLVVEDDQEIQNSYKDILLPETNVVNLRRSSRQQPVQTDESSFKKIPPPVDLTVVSSYAEAVKEFKQALSSGRPYAMAFFDVRLGGEKDGIELAYELSQLDPKLYMVFVTAYHDRSIESINVKLGEDSVDQWDYLNKPFTKSEIIQKSRNFLALWNLKEQQNIKDQQLKELNHLLSDHERKNMLAAISRGVSHEFGNILQQIIGKAELSVNKSEAGMKEALNKILDASQKASDILQKFKNMTENHQSTSEKEMVNVNELIKGTIDLMEHQFKVHQVKVCVIKNDPVFVNADPTALMQVFVNLFINASHAMVGAGQVDVSLINKADGQSLIIIRDYGPGVKNEEIEKVFEPLYTTKGEKGTGLGLPICREIIEIEHRGHLSLKNHPDKGLMVEILLPTQGAKDVAS